MQHMWHMKGVKSCLLCCCNKGTHSFVSTLKSYENFRGRRESWKVQRKIFSSFSKLIEKYSIFIRSAKNPCIKHLSIFRLPFNMHFFFSVRTFTGERKVEKCPVTVGKKSTWNLWNYFWMHVRVAATKQINEAIEIFHGDHFLPSSRSKRAFFKNAR